MLSCQFWNFEHIRSGRVAISSYGPYSLPDYIARHVDVVAGVTGFPLLPSILHTTDAQILANATILAPADLRTMYGVPSNIFGSATTSQAVVEFQGQFYSPSDLSAFFSAKVPFYPKGPVPVTVIGINEAGSPGVEASLDIEYIMGVAPGVNTTFYSYPNFNFWNDLTTWMNKMLSQTSPPHVVSVSYGDQTLSGQPSFSYKQSLDTLFKQAGVRGQ